MKILYAIQGTGNGHVTRAIELVPEFQKRADVDVLISGQQYDIKLPFKVKYRFNGLSFVFGKNGGVDVWKTYLKLNSIRLFQEIRLLDLSKYDLIISDFEPVSCWAAYRQKKTCIGLSNQVATLHPMAPKPDKIDLLGKLVLQNYAPSMFNYGFHFKALDKNIFTPVIRKVVRELVPTLEGHYVVYLPSYSDEKLVKLLKKLPQVKWHVFSKHTKEKYRTKNVKVYPILPSKFLKSMASANGVICNAGFGTASEALYLRKKLLVIPMKKQYEQHCNAAMLASMGVSVLNKLNKDTLSDVKKWLRSSKLVKVDYPDNAAEIVDTILSNHSGHKPIQIEATPSYYLPFK